MRDRRAAFQRTVFPRDFEKVLHAISFAARAHKHQLRKDRQTPYASHAFRVCLTLRHIFGVSDPDLLAAAVLHDTIEDAGIDFDDLEERFGRAVAVCVATLSKDKRMREDSREADYARKLRAASPGIKLIKLADLHDNLADASESLPGDARRHLAERARFYLRHLLAGRTDARVRKAAALVETLRSRLEA